MAHHAIDVRLSRVVPPSGDPVPTLSAAHERLLAAIADRVVPRDDYPSASETGATRFIARLLARELSARQAEVRDGLDRIDAVARASRASAFIDLAPDAQDAALQSIETGNHPETARFFAWLVERVLEGYYADPANGGNDGAASWRMLGFDPRRPDVDGTTR